MLLSRADEEARGAIDLASGLASTVVAVHACDPAKRAENSRFLSEWEALDLNVRLVMIAADPARVGVEVAAHIRRHYLRRQVHVLICATPASTTGFSATADDAARIADQLQQSLHTLQNVVVHEPPCSNLDHPAHENPQSRQCGPTSGALPAAGRFIHKGDASAEAGIQLAVMCVTVIVATMLCAVLGLSQLMTTLVVAAASVVSAQGVPLWWRLAGALVGWATVTGFVVNDFGRLTFAVQDLQRLALLVLLTMTLAPALKQLRRTR